MKTLLALVALWGTLASNASDITTVEGILYAHAAAIGGETTGAMVVHDDGVVTEIETSDPQMIGQLESLDLKRVVASGELRTVGGIEIPVRRLLSLQSIAAANRDVVCRAPASDYRVELALETLKARVLKGAALLTTLTCTKEGHLGARYSCYEPNVADAGYQVEFADTSGVPPHATLYEVFFWGRKVIDKLTCLP